MAVRDSAADSLIDKSAVESFPLPSQPPPSYESESPHQCYQLQLRKNQKSATVADSDLENQCISIQSPHSMAIIIIIIALVIVCFMAMVISLAFVEVRM
ncbi:hypothetical protein DL95DRAFT_388406 [Leptodontidium sp. 2 PMI_412]|nr:hypothetical protein DL95DRAFT_388406 [Leptodontidium sp. 2 PMI_412]